MARFRILGPLEVWSGQDWHAIGAAKQRGLLAMLLLNPGQVVSTDRLIDELWEDAPPHTAVNQISVYVHHLRRVIGDPDGKTLATRPPGYLIRLAEGDLDVTQFENLVVMGSRALTEGEPERASALLGEALGLWRGRPLADVPPTQRMTAEADRLIAARVTAAGLRARAELACGRAAAAVPELQRLVAENPMHEDLWALLIRAMLAAGRQAEALEFYGNARNAIAEELGVEPGAELRNLYQQILAADAAVADVGAAEGDVPGPSTPAATPPQAAPAQLPADIPDFTGRGAQVEHLCEVLARAADRGEGGAVVVSLVVGAGGLGKTTLAVNAAHRLRASFPDGQLYAALGGATEQPAPPADVLARFLRDLGVEGARVPVSEEERAALLRTQLTGKRVLIALDDARDAAQVRPLLPGSASCAVLVTARNRLPGLAGADVVDLDVLTEPEAEAMLARIVGTERLAAEPEPTARVLTACAGLPLAIRIAGARLASRERWAVGTLAGRLADERHRLDELAAGDLAVRACFEVSFASLPSAGGGKGAARAFRLLGLWPGMSISLPAAAALLGQPYEQAADALEALVDAHLLQSLAADRYRCHDLLRVYAAERALTEETQADRDAAIGRLLAWYLHTAAAADRVVSPHRVKVPLGEPPPGCVPLSFADVTGALSWCRAERSNLITAVNKAAALGLDEIAWKLAVAAMASFNRRGYWAEWMATHRTALASARRLGDRAGEAWVLTNLGVVYAQLHHADAIGYLEQARAIRRDLGDRRGEAHAANNLAFAYSLLGRFAEAADPLRDALEIQRAAGDRYGECVALSNLGETMLELGRAEEAVTYCDQAIAIAGGIGEQRVIGYSLNYLGRADLGFGSPAKAIDKLEQALDIHRRIGERYGEAYALRHLGLAQRLTGQDDAARQSWSDSLAIYTELGDEPRAAEVRVLLGELGTNDAVPEM